MSVNYVLTGNQLGTSNNLDLKKKVYSSNHISLDNIKTYNLDNEKSSTNKLAIETKKFTLETNSAIQLNSVNVVSSSSCNGIGSNYGSECIANPILKKVNFQEKLGLNFDDKNSVTNCSSLNSNHYSPTTTTELGFLFDTTNKNQPKWKFNQTNSFKKGSLTNEYLVSTTTKSIDSLNQPIEQTNWLANQNLKQNSYKSKVFKKNKNRKPYTVSSNYKTSFKDTTSKELISKPVQPLNLPLNINCGSDNIEQQQRDWNDNYEQQFNKTVTNKNTSNELILNSQLNNYPQLECSDQTNFVQQQPIANFSLNSIQTTPPSNYGSCCSNNWTTNNFDNNICTETSLNQFLKNTDYSIDNSNHYSSSTALPYYSHNSHYTNNNYTYHQPVCSDYYWSG